MKASLTITAIILAVAGIMGWQNHAKLTDARDVRKRLVEEARALGLEAEEVLKGGSSPRRMKTQREAGEDKQAHAKDFAKRLAAFANEMKKAQESGEEPDPGMQKRIFAIIDEMLNLDASQLKTLVAELRVLPDVDEEMRRGIIGFAIMTMAEDHPAAALALFTESSDILSEGGGPSNHVVTSALAKWAEDDPMAALEWVRANAKTHPDVVNDKTQLGILTGAARQDPRLAFKLIGELGVKNPREAGEGIARAVKTPAERTAVLEALRNHLKSSTDTAANEELEKSTMQALGGKMANEGYDASISWLESAALSGTEAKAVAESLSWWEVKGDTGKWIDWMSDKLPAEKFNHKVGEMMEQWTRQDYKAAGEWINASEDGPARQAAARTYAVTVAPYEPESAAQWAETLPPGKDRDEAFKFIHSEWENKDKAAAEEFARKHGIGQ
jgi:hypothetical protein